MASQVLQQEVEVQLRVLAAVVAVAVEEGPSVEAPVLLAVALLAAAR